MGISFGQSFRFTAKSHLLLSFLGIPLCFALFTLEPLLALITLRYAIPIGLLGLIPLVITNYGIGLVLVKYVKHKFYVSSLKAIALVNLVYMPLAYSLTYYYFEDLRTSFIFASFIAVQQLWYCYLLIGESEL